MHAPPQHQLIADHLYYSGAVADACFNELDLRGTVPFADVLGWAHQGLVEAADRFSTASGTTFVTFSFLRIRGAVIDGVRKSIRSRAGYVRAKHTEQSAGESTSGESPSYLFPPGFLTQADLEPDELPNGDLEPADIALDTNRLRAAVIKAIHELPDLERTVTLLFFYEGLRLNQIGKRLGLSRSYICRIHWRAIRQLESSLAEVASDHEVEVRR